jgi:hypothetical protein
MKVPPLANNYKSLTPEERFRLILAASGRGDVAERERLLRAGGRISLSMQDHAPYARALDDLDTMVFLELLEEAARYQDAFHQLHCCDQGDDDEVEKKRDEEPNAGTNEEELDGDWAVWHRYFDIALASGYILRAKADGWKLFCERMTILPFLFWEMLPGFDRLQRALALAEKAAFTAEGFLRWLNRIRPKGVREWTELPITAELVAKVNEAFFRERVRWWNG